MTNKIEKKWQKKWEDEKIFQSNPDEREKLYLTVAFPYPSGAMHIGHGRTYTVPDVYARFKRMQGYNVLFPMAWHVTGAPVIGIASRIKRKDEWTLNLYENVHKVPKETLPKLEDPEFIVKYFSNQYHEVMEDMGFSIDWRREFRTIDPPYKQFIRWQITKLYEKGYVIKGKHPVKYCPNDDNPVGDHDLLEGEGVSINELTLLKFKINNKILVPATLRPETIFGATNLWINPEIEYIEVKHEDETWIISKASYENLKNQKDNLEIIKPINLEEYIGQYAENPLTQEKIPLLPANFVDAEYGTGTVFSEPADAPADYIALQDLKSNKELLEKYSLTETVEKIEPIPIVKLKKYSEIPAKDIIEKLKITNQDDPKIKDATNELYKLEFNKGTVIDKIQNYGGEKVSIAREEVKEKMINENLASTMYDFAEKPVICRCGTKCIVKIMDDQWFLKYSDEDWTKNAREVLEGETIIPSEIKSNFEYYLGWLEDWACSRRLGLGTHLPWDKQWLIEPLSDSTIYMSYYTIAKYTRDMDPEKLTPALFDKVFLNKDPENPEDLKVDSETLQKIQDEFNYWYPLDWRLSAKDLVGNHLSFLMFHHSAIFPKDKWPKGTVVFGMGLLEGNKMSSSKGNIILLDDAIEEYSADVVRLFLMSSAEPWQDFDWREKEVLGTKRRLTWFSQFADKISEIKGEKIDLNNIKEEKISRSIDKWMLNQLNLRIKNATEALEVFQTRKALQEAFFLLKKDLDHYMYRTKHLIESKDPAMIYVLTTVLETWLRLLSPFTPHICEEIWSENGGEGFISNAKWPEFDENLINPTIERSETLVQNIVSDINGIKEMMKKDVEKIYIYTAPEWKWELYEIADKIGKPDIGKIMGEAISKNIYPDKSEIAKTAKTIGKEITKTKFVGKIDEKEILTDALDYIQEECGNTVIIHTDDSYDPKNRYKNAIPYKPAIYIEYNIF